MNFLRWVIHSILRILGFVKSASVLCFLRTLYVCHGVVRIIIEMLQFQMEWLCCRRYDGGNAKSQNKKKKNCPDSQTEGPLDDYKQENGGYGSCAQRGMNIDKWDSLNGCYRSQPTNSSSENEAEMKSRQYSESVTSKETSSSPRSMDVTPELHFVIQSMRASSSHSQNKTPNLVEDGSDYENGDDKERKANPEEVDLFGTKKLRNNTPPSLEIRDKLPIVSPECEIVAEVVETLHIDSPIDNKTTDDVAQPNDYSRGTEPMEIDSDDDEETENAMELENVDDGDHKEKTISKSILKKTVQNVQMKKRMKVQFRDPYQEPDEYHKNLYEEREERRRVRRERELNKQIRLILNEANVTYEKDTNGEDLNQFHRQTTNIRKKNIRKLLEQKKRAKNARKVDLCFLVDITQNNQVSVDDVRQFVNEFDGEMRSPGMWTHERSLSHIRICFVGYRDYQDAEHFVVHIFEKYTGQRFCMPKIIAHGGSFVNDVFGGLHTVLQQNWSLDSGTKVIFHVAKYPCHGEEFYNSFEIDSYSNGDPNGLTHADLFRHIRDMNIDYYFGNSWKDNKHTAAMTEKFSQVYGERIMEYCVYDPGALTKSVSDAIIRSVKKSANLSSARTVMEYGKHPRHHSIDGMQPDWTKIEPLEGKQIAYEFPESIDDLINCVPLARKCPTQVALRVAENPFASGTDSLVYFARDKTTEIVVKESLYVGIDRYSALRYEMTSQIQTIAAFLLEEFQDELQEEGEKFCVKISKVKTLCLPCNDGSGKSRFMNLEKLLPDYSGLIRFTDNDDYVLDECDVEQFEIDVNVVRIMTAFSHWTYEKTLKKFMVVNLRGFVGISEYNVTEILLVHPSIHCSDVTRFDQKNHGKDGMENFLRTHVCNHFCHSLELNPSSEQPEVHEKTYF